MKQLLENYLKKITETTIRGDAREESYYPHLKSLLENFSRKKISVTVLPKKTEAGNPDFRIWDGKQRVVGYIEAKAPGTNLNNVETSEQLQRYLDTFPNLILTDFYAFRLYRDGELIAQVAIGRPFIAKKLRTVPPVAKTEEFNRLMEKYVSFSLPKTFTTSSLAVELAKRTRFLRDEVIFEELKEQKKGKGDIVGFYEAFRKYLIAGLTERSFADLYSQTITYGLFAARTRSNGEFNRTLAFSYIPPTIGFLRDVFHFISLGNLPKQMAVIIDDISDVLNAADIKQILHHYYREGKGKDPIIHFYETFLSKYDPDVRERRGVYYTPESVVGYIVRSVHGLLKKEFHLQDGLASKDVTLLDPAGGTLTFPAEAIKQSVEEFTNKYGDGGKNQFIRNHILQNFYAFELMMAPYAIGHLKISFLLEELGYKLRDDDRFKLYLTNTMETAEIEQIAIPGLSSLSEESHQAGVVKKQKPLLVILGNPPYSGISSNKNEWTERLLKEDLNGALSYYKVDGKPLGERNPKWLQDDYVKFLRFAQWKIHKAGKGIVGMITNHSYLDNPTFRGMRQSLMRTFNEIYVLDLHGNSLKKETTPNGDKDENVFDIRQGVAIALFIKRENKTGCKIFHADLFGLRKEKYAQLESHRYETMGYRRLKPQSPWYFFVPQHTEHIQQYLDWLKVTDIFPVNGVGMTTARDNFVYDFDASSLINRIRLFKHSKFADGELHKFFDIRIKKGWSIRKAWQHLQEILDRDLKDHVKPALYRPFDVRFIFYHDSVVWRTVKKIMRHMLHGENLGLLWTRPQSPQYDFSVLVSNLIVDQCVVGNKSAGAGISYIAPLYIYPEKKESRKRPSGTTIMMVFDSKAEYGKTKRQPNIAPEVFENLEKAFGRKPSPEDILYYIYAVFYSDIYREKYAAFLKIDFPRVPFTRNPDLFKKMARLGKNLVDLHLLKSKDLDKTVAKYQGTGENDTIEKPIYQEKEQRVYINKEKYFAGIAPDVWNYHIGGYQVLQKYLKDRKGRRMEDPRHYVQIATAISATISLQRKIDMLYPDVEKELIKIDS